MTKTINLQGLNFTGGGAVDRVVQVYSPLATHMGNDEQWLRDEIYRGLIYGQELSDVVNQLNWIARDAGFTIQGNNSQAA